MSRLPIFVALATFFLGTGAGYWLHFLGHSKQWSPHRIMEWGEHYFDLADDVNSPQNTLDIFGLEKLFGAKFDVQTAFYVNHDTTIDCCLVRFGQEIYYVTRPLPVGSFNNSTFGFDFYIRKQNDLRAETDTPISIFFDRHRRITSVAFRRGIFGSTKQLFVDPETIEPTIHLASSVRSSMRRAMRGDNHKDDYWNRMPNFVEKFIVAVDNNIKRNAEQGAAE